MTRTLIVCLLLSFAFACHGPPLPCGAPDMAAADGSDVDIAVADGVDLLVTDAACGHVSEPCCEPALTCVDSSICVLGTRICQVDSMDGGIDATDTLPDLDSSDWITPMDLAPVADIACQIPDNLPCGHLGEGCCPCLSCHPMCTGECVSGSCGSDFVCH